MEDIQSVFASGETARPMHRSKVRSKTESLPSGLVPMRKSLPVW